MIFILLILFVLSPASPLQSTMLLPQKEAKTDDLTARADTAFKGVCQSKRQDFATHPTTHAKIPIDVYTFKVEEGLKGNLKEGERVEVKQIGVKTRREAIELKVESVTGTNFDIGKKYLILLGKPSLFGTDTIIGGNQ